MKWWFLRKIKPFFRYSSRIIMKEYLGETDRTSFFQKYWIFFQIPFFYLIVQSFQWIMKNDFIRMAESGRPAHNRLCASIMRSSKTGLETLSVASAVCHVAPSFWNQMLPIPSSFNLCEPKFVQHSPITIAIDWNAKSLLIFETVNPLDTISSCSTYLGSIEVF